MQIKQENCIKNRVQFKREILRWSHARHKCTIL